MAVKESPSASIVAEENDIAKVVLMPGDPLRAKYVAEHYLENPVCFNTVRNMLGYTGTYKGVKISVMGHGMGVPSVGIYSYELYNFYGVENIIRIGSAGALSTDLHVMDVVAGMGACTDSNFAHQFGLNGTFAPIADYKLLSTAVEAAKAKGIQMKVGNILSSDNFYGDCDPSDLWAKMGVMAVEMEAAGLYMNAARAGKRALCICTISDHIMLPEEILTSDQRQTAMTQMIEIALDTAAAMNEA